MSDRVQLPPPPEPLPVEVVDNHCHLDIPGSSRDLNADPIGDLELSELLERAASVGVPRALQISYDLKSARWTTQVVDQHPQLLGGVALHPNEAPRLAAQGGFEAFEAAFAEIEQLAQHPRVRVVGETGLDYFRTEPEGREVQQESFRRHIALAKRLGLAMQIHDRDAHGDVLRILEEEGAPDRTVFHCFSGDEAMARECAERGYYLSFAGTVTFKNAQNLRDALAVTPLDRLQIETDAPYLTPMPYRGRPNASYLVPLTVRAMADVLDIDVQTLCETVVSTSERLYGRW
ncbi:MAG TPA: TatD family hydrolase [Actinomycetales bacterium]|nr:TatD family hydrolase [Actinomycetales bacterium]